MNPFGLQDRVIAIIGGTGGLGWAAARACHEAGARLALLGNRPDELGEVRKVLPADSCRVHEGDARQPDRVENLLDDAVRQWGRLDGLVHIAGGSGRSLGDGPLARISESGWRDTLDWNLTSVFHSNQAAVKRFLSQQSPGSIVNISSVLARHPVPRHFGTQAYAAAKAGIAGLTRSAAAQYAARNIRFNAIASGLVETPMSRRAQADPAILDFIRRKQPLDGGRMGRAEDLTGAIRFFLSDASRFITGQILEVDGGWSVSDGGAGPGEVPT